jgi:hypothetical protein
MQQAGFLPSLDFEVGAAQALLNVTKNGALRNGPEDDMHDASLVQATVLGSSNREVYEATMQNIAAELSVQAGGKDTGFYFRYLRLMISVIRDPVRHLLILGRPGTCATRNACGGSWRKFPQAPITWDSFRNIFVPEPHTQLGN